MFLMNIYHRQRGAYLFCVDMFVLTDSEDEHPVGQKRPLPTKNELVLKKKKYEEKMKKIDAAVRKMELEESISVLQQNLDTQKKLKKKTQEEANIALEKFKKQEDVVAEITNTLLQAQNVLASL